MPTARSPIPGTTGTMPTMNTPGNHTARTLRHQGLAKVLLALALATTAMWVPVATADTRTSAEKTLPRPASLQPWVDFWIDVYGRHHDGVLTLHDSRDAGIVYATLETPRGQSLRDRRLRAEPEIDAFREALLDVAEGERRARTPYHDRVLALWGPDANPLTLRAAAEHIRFQVGHAEAFRDALSRSRVWRPWINRVLTAHRLPRELGAIPFVESFFRPDVAASGNLHCRQANATCTSGTGSTSA